MLQIKGNLYIKLTEVLLEMSCVFPESHVISVSGLSKTAIISIRDGWSSTRAASDLSGELSGFTGFANVAL